MRSFLDYIRFKYIPCDVLVKEVRVSNIPLSSHYSWCTYHSNNTNINQHHDHSDNAILASKTDTNIWCPVQMYVLASDIFIFLNYQYHHQILIPNIKISSNIDSIIKYQISNIKINIVIMMILQVYPLQLVQIIKAISISWSNIKIDIIIMMILQISLKQYQYHDQISNINITTMVILQVYPLQLMQISFKQYQYHDQISISISWSNNKYQY